MFRLMRKLRKVMMTLLLAQVCGFCLACMHVYLVRADGAVVTMTEIHRFWGPKEPAVC